MTNESPSLQFGPISPAAPGALYEQVVAAVTRELAAGRLRPGDPLPSVRRLAADLLVSVITIKRAYDELERAGLIYSRQGLGAFVAEGAGDGLATRALDDVRAHLGAAIAAARHAQLPPSQLLHLFRTLLEEPDLS